MTMPEIFKVMALSTAHLTREVGKKLDEVMAEQNLDPEHWSSWIVGSGWGDYGWWIWSESEVPDGEMPDCLDRCLTFARDHGCRFVQFDCDVPPIPELPQHDW